MPEPLISLQAIGLRDTRGRFAAAKDALPELQLANAELLKDEVVGVFRAYAPKRTGVFAAGITGHVVSTGAAGFAMEVAAANGNLREWLKHGTGIYGPENRPITPRRARFLRFTIDGTTIFARSVRGMRPNDWEEVAWEEAAPLAERGANRLAERVTRILQAP